MFQNTKTLLERSEIHSDNKLAFSLLNTIDSRGNTFVLNQSILYLKNADGRTKKIGSLSREDGIIVYRKYEKEAEVFRKTNAWSIPVHINEHVDQVRVYTKLGVYVATTDRIAEYSDIFTFKDQEVKLYLPKKYWDFVPLSEKDEKLNMLLGLGWANLLRPQFNKDYMKKLGRKLQTERKNYILFPEPANTFRAFRLTYPKDVKVVILGQDPYHDGSADGLSFSYKQGTSLSQKTKSLDVIWQEIERDVKFGLYLNFDYDLTYWAKQGVLLLNTALTVRKGEPNSHQWIGWEKFIKAAIAHIIISETPVVFMLWGSTAKRVVREVKEVLRYAGKLDEDPHLYLKAVHPAADIHNNVYNNSLTKYDSSIATFKGCSHFSKANEFLKVNKRNVVNW